jgi:hypothetical protein
LEESDDDDDVVVVVFVSFMQISLKASFVNQGNKRLRHTQATDHD